MLADVLLIGESAFYKTMQEFQKVYGFEVFRLKEPA